MTAFRLVLRSLCHYWRTTAAVLLGGIAATAAGAPALARQGSLELQTGGDTKRVGRVQVYGVDDRLWKLTEHGAVAPPAGREILLNRRVAEQLGLGSSTLVAVDTNQEVTLTVELPAAIPRDALLGAPGAEGAAKLLTETLSRSVTLRDIDLRLRKHSDRGYFALESDRQILEDALARAAECAADAL